MADTYPLRNPAVQSDPAVGAIAITGSDQTFTNPVRGVYCGGAGNLKVDMADGSSGVTFTGMLAGIVYPIAITKIYGSGTSITSSLVLL